MPSIPRHQPHDQAFPEFYRDICRRPRRTFYHAASLNAIGLNNSQFAVYSMIAVLANFGSRVADLKYKARVIRGWRTKKQIGRILAALVCKGYVVRHDTRRYSLTGRVERRNNARLRPLNAGILHAAANPDTALYARFMVAIAASRKKWDRLTWRDVQRLMHCNTGTAQALYRGLQAVRAFDKGGSRGAARRAVFWSKRPEWYRYREHNGGRVLMDPRPGAAGLLQRPPGGRSQNVPAGPCPIGSITRGILTSRAGRAGPDVGGKPARKQGRRLDQSVAALVLRQDRRRRRGRLAAISAGDVAATRATARPCGRHMENGTIPAGSVYEQLIAGLPEKVKQSFERQPAVIAERRRRRLDMGYQA